MPKAKLGKKAMPSRRPFQDDPGKWRRTRPYLEMWSCPEGIPARLMHRELKTLTSGLFDDQAVTFHFVVCQMPPFLGVVR